MAHQTIKIRAKIENEHPLILIKDSFHNYFLLTVILKNRLWKVLKHSIGP